jgi:hypothetical protein
VYKLVQKAAHKEEAAINIETDSSDGEGILKGPSPGVTCESWNINVKAHNASLWVADTLLP